MCRAHAQYPALAPGASEVVLGFGLQASFKWGWIREVSRQQCGTTLKIYKSRKMMQKKGLINSVKDSY